MANNKNLKPFVKGADPRRNVKGAPKKLPELEELFIKTLGAERNDVTAAEAVIIAQINKAVKGDTRAAEWLFDRGYGKVTQKLDVAAEFSEKDYNAELKQKLANLAKSAG